MTELVGVPGALPPGAFRRVPDRGVAVGTGGFASTWHADGVLRYGEPARRPEKSLPTGNGDLGVAVWAPRGLALQLNKSDTWDGDGNLVGLCRVRLELAGEPFATPAVRHELDTVRSCVRVAAADGLVSASVWAPPDRQAVIVDVEDGRAAPGELTVELAGWRPAGRPDRVGPDSVLFEGVTASSWRDVAAAGEMAAWTESHADPLLGRCWMVRARVDGATPTYPGYWHVPGARRHRLVLVACTDDSTTGSAALGKFPPGWHRLRATTQAALDAVLAAGPEQLWRQHCAWWAAFWARARFAPDLTDSRAAGLHAAWHLNRYYAACAGRAAFPIKWNGGPFLFHGDRRFWGGAYWWQNTRLVYWPLLKSGDWDLCDPLFDTYAAALPYHVERTRRVYAHGGAVFPETMHFWGGLRHEDVSPPWSGRAGGINPSIRHHWSGSLELLAMLLDRQAAYPDGSLGGAGRAFADDRVLPIAEAVMAFFDEHFPRDAAGRLRLYPAQALETYRDLRDPADQVAGLRSVLPRLIRLGERLDWPAQTIARWRRLAHEVPPLPRGRLSLADGQVRLEAEDGLLAPAAAFDNPRKENREDPELYAVWPFRLYGVGMEDLELARRTFARRLHPAPDNGWSQTAIWAACLGLPDDAAALAAAHRQSALGFPSGLRRRPQLPDAPYFDAPGAVATAIQEMLLQENGAGLHVLPAWPRDLAVRFRLHSVRRGWLDVDYRPGAPPRIEAERG